MRGFLGIGERYHALPWQALRDDEKLGGYVVGIKKEALAGGPSFARDAPPRFDRMYGTGLYSHYGMMP